MIGKGKGVGYRSGPLASKSLSEHEAIPEAPAQQSPDRNVKLSCRNLWKVYGPDAARYFPANSGVVDDPPALIKQIRSDGLIAAACNVSFDLQDGEIFVIMGLSGSGKSTVVRCLSRLVEPTAGEIVLDNLELLKASKTDLIELRRHKMGMVFQHFGLLPHLTVLENVAFPLKVQGIAPAERNRRAGEMIKLVGLKGREYAYPRQLSGGQQQRVGIARSLAVEPEIWFLDEPFSALDPLIRRQMQDEFLRLQRLLNKSIVFITHDFLEALRVADRIAIMKDGEVVQRGSPSDVIMRPANDYVAEFTCDVPRAKLITAGNIMSPSGDHLTTSEAVPETITLEQLVSRFSKGLEVIPVCDDAGSIVGQISAQEILTALASAEEESP